VSSETERKPRLQEDAVCEVCGKYGAYVFDGKTLCVDCYEAAGSCCAWLNNASLSARELLGAGTPVSVARSVTNGHGRMTSFTELGDSAEGHEQERNIKDDKKCSPHAPLPGSSCGESTQ